MKRCFFMIMMCGTLLFNACGATTDNPSADSETNMDTEINEGQEKNEEIIKSNLTMWNNVVLDSANQSILFEDFYVGEKLVGIETVPVLYNENMQLAFMGNYIELIKYDTQESYNIELPSCSCDNSITLGRMHLNWADINQDNVDDIIFTETFSATGRMQMVDVIDGKSMDVLAFNYSVEDLSQNLPNFEILEEKVSSEGLYEVVCVEYEVQGKKYTNTIDVSQLDVDSLEMIVDVNSQDYRWCSENGVIMVETAFGFGKKGSVHIDCVGVLKGELEYRNQEKGLVLNVDSIQIEWMDM